MNQSYLSSMHAHLDEGGQLAHINGIELLGEVERLRGALSAATFALQHDAQHFHDVGDNEWRDKAAAAAQQCRVDLDTPPAMQGSGGGSPL